MGNILKELFSLPKPSDDECYGVIKDINRDIITLTNGIKMPWSRFNDEYQTLIVGNYLFRSSFRIGGPLFGERPGSKYVKMHGNCPT